MTTIKGTLTREVSIREYGREKPTTFVLGMDANGLTIRRKGKRSGAVRASWHEIIARVELDRAGAR